MNEGIAILAGCILLSVATGVLTPQVSNWRHFLGATALIVGVGVICLAFKMA